MKVNISKVNQGQFVNFINRLKVIDSFVYFKIKDDVVEASAYLPQRDAVKHNRLPLSEIFQIQDGEITTDKDLKIAFFDATRLIDAFKQFDGESVRGELDFIENDTDCVATSLKIFSNELEITLACSEPSLGYKDLTDAQISSIFNVDGANFDFEFDYSNISKVKSLFGLDKDETFSIKRNKDGVRLKGKTYNMLVTPKANGDDSGDVTLFKKYLNLLDKEDYTAHVLSNRVVMKSNDSETLLTIATCQSA